MTYRPHGDKVSISRERIVLVNTFDVTGGAARAAYRLHQGLRRIHLDSHMVVQNKKSDDPSVVGPAGPLEKADALVRGIVDQVPLALYPGRTATPFSPSWVPFSPAIAKIRALEPRVTHLHWVQKSMLAIQDWKRLPGPLVWTLHDMWAFTGGEHYDEGQHHWYDECGRSRVLGSTRAKDLSHYLWKKKRAQWQDVEFTVVCPSHWMAKEASRSSLLGARPTVVIPNGIDTAVFRPFDKETARSLLNLPTKKPTILFPSMDPTSDPRKGFDLLCEGLEVLRHRGLDVHLLILGAAHAPRGLSLPFSHSFLGLLHDDVSLELAYNAADVVVVPSRQENFPNTILEAMACGVPAVAFDIGGNGDLIDHHFDGYLAEAESPGDLANGIHIALTGSTAQKWGQTARRKVELQYEITHVARLHAELYQEVLGRSGATEVTRAKLFQE